MDTRRWNSRRSCVMGRNGAVSSSQPLASEVGLTVLRNGGNAADAAVAVAAALNVTEPCSTGIGGDMFCLFYDAKTKEVKGLNGSGRSPQKLTMDTLRQEGLLPGQEALPADSIHCVTVPGACAGWIDCLHQFGTRDISEVLQGAIKLAEEGFPVSEVTAGEWARGVEQLIRGPHARELLIDGRAPKHGEIMRNPTLAETFRTVAKHGKDGFYKGRIAEEIVKVCQSLGGTITLADLAAHESQFVEPIKTSYRGVDVYEIPPNGQGLTALLALNMLESFDVAALGHNSPEYLHLLIEAMRISFADARYHIADPDHSPVPVQQLLSKEYAMERLKQYFDPKKAAVNVVEGSPLKGSETVYLSVVDGEGNAASFINSNYEGFGSGIIPEGCGFTLQNRGANFSLVDNHPNVLAPGKRPFHTIIPSMAIKNDALFACYGVMGGFMQPQGHVQVMCNMIDFDMSPQMALDAARFCISDGTADGWIGIEDGVEASTVDELQRFGHNVRHVEGAERRLFGRGQIITRDADNGVLACGCDPRSDGIAIAF